MCMLTDTDGPVLPTACPLCCPLEARTARMPPCCHSWACVAHPPAARPAARPAACLPVSWQVTAFYWMSNLSAGWYEHHWRHLSQPVLDSGLPFAVNLGNHDGEADLSRRQVVQLAMRTSERSLTKVCVCGGGGRPPPSGCSSRHRTDIL